MFLIPAIYIKDGKTVALATGGKPFNTDPVAMAASLADVGVEAIYVVDRNMPPGGHIPHLGIVEGIIKNTKLKVYLSGHVKSLEVIEKYLAIGVETVCLGVIAYQKPDFLKEACEKFPGKITAHIEVKSGKVVITGWSVATRKTDLDYAQQFKDAGVTSIIYSNSEEDGKVSPLDLQNMNKFLIRSPLSVIQGADVQTVSELESILALSSHKMIGTILSKSIYSGAVDIASTITHAKDNIAPEMDEPTLIP